MFSSFTFGNTNHLAAPFELGTYKEAEYYLQTFGIQLQDIPVDENGQMPRELHLDWIKRVQAQEMSGEYDNHVIVPRRFDVLFGKGTKIADFTGNLRAFHIVEMNRAKYEKAGKFEKCQIATKIVQLIKQSYGRFLRKEDGCWTIVDDETARLKISHYFRRLRESDAKTKSTKIAKRNPSSSSSMSSSKPDPTSSRDGFSESSAATQCNSAGLKRPKPLSDPVAA